MDERTTERKVNTTGGEILSLCDRTHLVTEATKGTKWIYNSQKSPELATVSIKRKWPNANVTRFDLCGADVAPGLLRRKNYRSTRTMLIIDRYGHREEVEGQLNKLATIPKQQVMFCKPVECQGSTWQVRKALRSDCKKRAEQALRNFEEAEKRHAPKLMGKECTEKFEKGYERRNG